VISLRTPGGRECPYYYEDFNRGAEIQRCRVARSSRSDRWRPRQCDRCPVPAIEAASGGLDLTLTVHGRLLGLGERFTVDAWCDAHGPVDDPFVGCLGCVAKVEL
jgi:hypothetical protein